MVEVAGEEALGRVVVPEGPDSSLCLAAGADLQGCGAPAELLLSGVGRLGTVGQGEHQHGDLPCGTEGGGQAGKSGASGRVSGAE